uniref:Uncharacterized protein n=1 Tax=Arundo donax TaxID=35708 RepID=A0A0A9BQ79_ARUDO
MKSIFIQPTFACHHLAFPSKTQSSQQNYQN